MPHKYPEKLIHNIRKLEPFYDTDVNGFQYEVKPEKVRITTKNTASCRACQFPLDVGVKAIRCQAFSGREPRRARKAPLIYIHEEDCLQEGFICTLGFRGKAPDYFVIMVKGEPREGRIERSEVSMWTTPSGFHRVGFSVQDLGPLSPETKAMIEPKKRKRPENKPRYPASSDGSTTSYNSDRWPPRDRT